MQLDVTHPDLWNEVYLDFLDEPRIYNILYGGAGCFQGNQLVSTKEGNKPIESIQKGELVLSFNHASNQYEYKQVLNCFRYDRHDEGLIEIKMKDGTIIKVTENHKFFWRGKYVHIKEILSIFEHGKDLENNTRI